MCLGLSRSHPKTSMFCRFFKIERLRGAEKASLRKIVPSDAAVASWTLSQQGLFGIDKIRCLCALVIRVNATLVRFLTWQMFYASAVVISTPDR